MPEIKNVFRSGIMNKDDDERIIPNGQYRDAMNIEVATSDDSDVGTVQNILGNKKYGLDKSDFVNADLNGFELKCIASISDEKNDRLFYFLFGNTKDFIIEHKSDNTEELVFVDTTKEVLKFDKDTIVTGINIIDNLLFWTDNINEPRKINIDNCKEGTTDENTHTRLIINGEDRGDITEDHIVVIKRQPYYAPKVVAGETVIQDQFTFESANILKNGGLPIPDTHTLDFTIVTTSNIHPFQFAAGDVIVGSRPNTPGQLPINFEIKLKVLNITTDTFNANTGTGEFTAEYEILELSTDISESDAADIIFNVRKLTEEKPIFEKEFVRFATRYKYVDGEYSAFSPFTQPVFLAGAFGFHPIKDSHNVGMTNKLLTIKLQDLVPDHTPNDVVQIDILFKKDDSTTIYTIDSIRPDDGEGYWTDNSYNAYDVVNFNYTSGSSNVNTALTTVNIGYSGQYEINTENIYAALPANQILRPFDNVPRKALAQEITGNRLVYGNYLQNYNLKTFEDEQVYVDLDLDFENRDFGYDGAIDFSTGKRSIKTDRTYYLGIVYGDKYGRETPVFTGKNSSIKIPFDADDSDAFDGNASKSLQLCAHLTGRQPSWAHYYKYFIKQTTSGYHNLTLDRVYKSIRDQSMWLSFPSSDRNKLQEGDYVIMKKEIDTNNQVDVNNKIKIIDISNEAPESIKFNLTTLGTGGGSEENLADLFPDLNGKPAEDAVRIAIDKETWINTEFGSNLDKFTSSDRFALQFSIRSGNVRTFSDIYFVASAYQEDDGANGRYVFILRRKIQAADAWIESSAGTLDSSLTIELFLLENKDTIEFEGRFFAKVASTPLTQKFLIPSQNDVDDFALVARAFAFWLADSPRPNENRLVGNSGIYNTTSGASNSWSNNTNSVTSTTSAATDTEQDWSEVTKFNTENESTPGWFIDNTHFASAQEPFDYHNQWDAFYSGRMYKGNPLSSSSQEVNGLEGIVEVDNSSGKYGFSNGNPQGARHWTRYRYGTSNSLNQYETPNGQEFLETYKATGPYATANPNKGIFMHLSFACPGVDLHDGNFSGLGTNASTSDVPGFRQNLQWILAGGIHFQGDKESSVGKNYYEFNQNVTAAGLEAHDNQFNPGYLDNSAQAVANQLAVGNQFKFEGDDVNVYTIQSVDVKYLYNHTSWNPVVRENISGASFPENLPDNSVSEALDSFAANPSSNTKKELLKERIVNFGKANNRRTVYIIQLDKDPRATGMYDPRGSGKATPTTFNAINFIDTYIQPGKNTLPITPAIFETEAKEEPDLNIYFESSNAYPRILDLTDGSGPTSVSSDLIGAASNVIQDAVINPNSTKGSMLAPVGSRVVISDSSLQPDFGPIVNAFPEKEIYVRITGWDGNLISLVPGFLVSGNDITTTGQTNIYNQKVLTFYREDGSYTKAAIFSVRSIAPGGQYVNQLELFPLVHNRKTALPYYNCISFGNGVESIRIRDDFNGMQIAKGVKASATIEQAYEEERRKYGLIHSGLYNSTSGVNNLNQFIQAEKITKDINPVYGSIQKLYARNKDLVTLCEDKVLQIFVDRDLLFNADGNTQLLTSNRFLGATQPFRGNYGISKNPESFAAESFRAYFTDKQRGAVMRLSMDGLTAISEIGMKDYFRDELPKFDIMYGSYDAYKGDYNLTLRSSDDLPSNIIGESGEEIVDPYSGQTITFSEKAKGWVSFKSFIPEIGVSCVNQYYTFNQGDIYKHYNEDSPAPRNTFYGNFTESSVTPVLNLQPELVKHFNTLNYEGTQSRVAEFTTITQDGVDYEDGSFYNLQEKKGWYVEDIHTNKQEGTLIEFIEKEGKWYNYIRGTEEHVDPAAFNFQGLGIVSETIAQ